MSKPMTEAGRALLDDFDGIGVDIGRRSFALHLAAIEAQARADAEATIQRLREALDEASAWVWEAVRNPDPDRIQATQALAKRIDRVLADTAPEGEG